MRAGLSPPPQPPGGAPPSRSTVPAVDRVPACAVECRAGSRYNVPRKQRNCWPRDLQCALTVEFLRSVHTASSFLSHSLYRKVRSKRKSNFNACSRMKMHFFVDRRDGVVRTACVELPPFAPTTRRNEPDAGSFWRALLFGGSWRSTVRRAATVAVVPKCAARGRKSFAATLCYMYFARRWHRADDALLWARGMRCLRRGSGARHGARSTGVPLGDSEQWCHQHTQRWKPQCWVREEQHSRNIPNQCPSNHAHSAHRQCDQLGPVDAERRNERGLCAAAANDRLAGRGLDRHAAPTSGARPGQRFLTGPVADGSTVVGESQRILAPAAGPAHDRARAWGCLDGPLARCASTAQPRPDHMLGSCPRAHEALRLRGMQVVGARGRRSLLQAARRRAALPSRRVRQVGPLRTGGFDELARPLRTPRRWSALPAAGMQPRCPLRVLPILCCPRRRAQVRTRRVRDAGTTGAAPAMRQAHEQQAKQDGAEGDLDSPSDGSAGWTRSRASTWPRRRSRRGVWRRGWGHHLPRGERHRGVRAPRPVSRLGRQIRRRALRRAHWRRGARRSDSTCRSHCYLGLDLGLLCRSASRSRRRHFHERHDERLHRDHSGRRRRDARRRVRALDASAMQEYKPMRSSSGHRPARAQLTRLRLCLIVCGRSQCRGCSDDHGLIRWSGP